MDVRSGNDPYEAGQRLQETHTPAGSPNLTRTITYTYDESSRLTGYSDTNNGHPDHLAHGASYTLDALGRKTQETITLGSQTLTLATTYALTGQKERQRGPGGNEITYAWDDAQRLQETRFPDGSRLSAQAYDPWNQIQRQLYPGGGARTHAYDGLARLKHVEVKNPQQQVLMQRAYTYDGEANITGITSEHGDSQYQYQGYRIRRCRKQLIKYVYFQVVMTKYCKLCANQVYSRFYRVMFSTT